MNFSKIWHKSFLYYNTQKILFKFKKVYVLMTSLTILGVKKGNFKKKEVTLCCGCLIFRKAGTFCV